MENDQQNTIKLLNVKSTKEKVPDSQKKSDKEKEQRRIQDEELKQMIEAKMNLLENSGVTAESSKKNENNVENILEAKLQKIFQNGDLDNKEKIAQMTELFNNEIIPNYRDTMAKIVKVTSDQTINEYLKEWHEERLNSAKAIQNKYMVISQEYQNQAKSFREKHEEIYAQELAKREEISNNFTNHFA